MAATQAESQQNDVKLNESVKCAQKRPQVGGNSASVNTKQQLDPEPGDKVSRGAAQLLKYVNRGGDTGFEMSQYREDIGGHTAGEVKSPREAGQAPQESIGKQEPLDTPGHPNHPGHPFTSNVIRDYPEEYTNKSNEFPSKSLTEYPSKQVPEYIGKHGDFPGKQLDYHGKHLIHESERVHRAEMEEHYAASKIESRLAYVGATPSSFPGQPRFLSGQSISQATGPTPTLNQLLQASTPVHRFHGNYPGMGPEPYQQPWPIQRPPVVPPVYPQPGQRPPQTGSPRLHAGPGGPSSPTPMPYQQYTQRYSSPARPHAPYSHHQLNSYTTQSSHPSSLYTEQRGWNQGGPPNPPPPPANQTNPSSQSPQRALSQSPAPPPSASPQPQSTGQSQSFHNLQQRSTTPNTQGIDSGELSGQNSNDSSNGPACPGTPNSQGMRPTPSPTGSTGSRSMSPAVGQQNVQMPPRPSSSQSDGSGPARMSHSPMTTQGAYQQPLGPSPHMHSYKMNNTGPGVVQPGPGSASLGGMNPMGGGMGYAASGTAAGQPGGYHTQGTYPPPRPHVQFPQGYPSPANSQPPPNNQYQASNRPNNLVQYPPYTHKMGFNSVPPGMPPSPGPPQVYGGSSTTGMVPPGTPGVAVIGNMGPPASSMGPPPPSPNHISSQPPPTSSAVPHLHTPAATPPLNHEGSPMPPPSTTPNSHPTSTPTPASHNSADLTTETSNDSGITTTASGTSGINVTSTSSGTVTSVITTGPDGTSLDEGSQQSTLSNASAASGEDPAFTPKVRKEMIGGYHSHPTTPQSTVPSPGAASINSIHEEYPDMNSPGWPRTPASPVFNSHVPQDPYRSKKPDSLAKLYEMDDSMERRTWLDKLVNFMEERRTPITSCPTISKNPLDLFRLYLYVKERGGFMEVCKVTKNKTWKDIAGLLGIGASSSAAYTLRKHYTKHLLAYECHFDRGGVDPQPIINQVEAGSKKKPSKATASVPSPGSSNSQDSFPAAGSSNASMDGYGSYQSSYTGGTPGGPSSEYTPPPPRPPSQSSAPSPHQGGLNQGGQNSTNPFDDGVGRLFRKSNATPHPGPLRASGIQQGSYQNTGSYQNYPQDQYIRPQANTLSQQGEFNQPYSPRSHYSPYVPDVDRGYPGGNMPPNNAGGQDIYNRYSSSQQPANYSAGTPPNARSNSYPSAPQAHPATVPQQTATSQPSSPSQPSAASSYSCPQDYYRQEQGGYGAPGGTQIYSSGANANKNMPPPPPGPNPPRRHPDFAKDQQYPQYNQQRPAYPGWPNTTNQYNSTSGNNRVQYPSQQPQSQTQQQQQQSQQQTPQSASSTPSSGLANNQQWGSQQPNRTTPQPTLNAIAHAPPPWDHRYSNQPSPLYPAPGNHQNQLGINPMINQQPTSKREMTFPPDSVEAITPLLYKRRKLTRADVAPIEAWRIMMALRSGLLAESCWALDVLNILLFDDSSVSYFGLAHLPGLLDVLLEHFSRSLSDMFESPVNEDDRNWNQSADGPEVDLGAVTRPIDPEDRTKLLSSSNYTLLSRRGRPVKIIPRDDDLFVLDTRRSWDHQDCESETEPWQVDNNTTKYIVTCFQSEIGTVPFARLLRDEKPPLLQKEVECTDLKDETKADSGTLESLEFSQKITESGEKPKETNEKKQLDKKKKTKTLSDVLSRIKKEPVEMNDLTRELFEKKNDGFKKECDTEAKVNNNMGEHFSDMQKSEEELILAQNGLNDTTNNIEMEKNEIKIENEEQESVMKNDNKEGPRLKIRDPAGTLKRRRISDYEDESYSRDEASLYLVTETQDNLARRCVCLSTILRNLTFIPGNEAEFAKNVTFLSLLGKLLLLHHEHPVRTQKTRNYDREEDADFADSCSSLQGESEWWWDFLHHIRENVLVMAANIAGHMDLSQHPEEISRPVLDGLLHWAVCPAAHGQDPFPTVGPNSSLSPQRLALEALCKLCVTECNVDLVVATPPYSRLQRLCSVLTRLLCRSEEQVLREFGVNLLHFLSAADSGVARTIALQTPCVALLVAFIEQAESSALGVANQHGLAALRDNPESMGTSLDMLRRAAGTLLNLARHPDNRTLLLQHESRLLALVMSQILDQQVAAIVARVLFQCSRGT
ncbi:trithorax group protein osa isoform X1 [Apis mellifera caucasica]|uniref:Trithorax group protein osa isoform X1 n=1 Tax=Apis mellifera TaxID=7460 RepID=A0A7M7GWN3_APIME|nr:trithorax group protein osa isoform X1 [Apis mellifera]KAG6799870.1 trithorax group protein osa isoform X1 [Apis mellifera caucasica]KAG9435790.1 trithorax group protein osa isoform X1 [Apis mellifera carnica]|eukprot:XP_006566725.1 trithorax group protein osa isoform X1 [Apis mellifera]